MTTNTEHRRRETDKVDQVCIKYQLEKANARIAELESANKFIPVFESLPVCARKKYAGGYSDEVIVSVVCENGVKFVSTDRYDKHTKSWVEHNDGGRIVTHWMPLPAPPAAAKEGE